MNLKPRRDAGVEKLKAGLSNGGLSEKLIADRSENVSIARFLTGRLKNKTPGNSRLPALLRYYEPEKKDGIVTILQLEENATK